MAKPCIIFLHFSPTFAADLADSLIEFNACDKGGVKVDTYWTFGTLPSNSVVARPPTRIEDHHHYDAISRIQFTVKWDALTKNFYILDGGVCSDESILYKEGNPIIRPSRNGVWVNSIKMTYGDWELIRPGDLIYLGNGKKIVVRGSEFDTLNEEIWSSSDWIIKETDSIEETAVITEDLETDNPWGLLSKIFDWFVRPGKSKAENRIKIFLLSLIIAIILSEELKLIIEWFNSRN